MSIPSRLNVLYIGTVMNIINFNGTEAYQSRVNKVKQEIFNYKGQMSPVWYKIAGEADTLEKINRIKMMLDLYNTKVQS
jgi:hypothetical protein